MPTQTAEFLAARLRAVHARGRTADVLLGIALDVLEPYALDYLSAVDYRRLCDLVTEPVNAATEAAQATLAQELARRLPAADPLLVARLAGSPRTPGTPLE